MMMFAVSGKSLSRFRCAAPEIRPADSAIFEGQSAKLEIRHDWV
jgi:hypothetical protein